MAEIKLVENQNDYEVLGDLFREYQAGLGFDLCFQNFEKELSELSLQYGPPDGRAYLALIDGEAVGCVAVRKFQPAVCEMKRMYIRTDHRGRGLGRVLAKRVVEGARDLGYGRMRLDTLGSMKEATRLYRSMGFRPIDPYRPNPMEDPMFFELDLVPGPSPSTD